MQHLLSLESLILHQQSNAEFIEKGLIVFATWLVAINAVVSLCRLQPKTFNSIARVATVWNMVRFNQPSPN